MTGKGNWLARSWLQRGLAACLLWPLSLLYGLVSGLHRCLYRTGIINVERCAVPVIVVGNVVAGGAGKTPLVIALVLHLQQRGLRVGVVSRGYGRLGKNCLEVLENTTISESGDEPALILRATAAPVFVATKRIEAALALLQKYPDIELLVCDDGLQHHGLARDVEVVVFDDRGVGNGWLLPAGPLREPWPRGRQTKTALVLHTGNAPAFEGYTASRQLAAYGVTADGTQVLLSSLKGQPLTAIAAIANPQAFFAMLAACGLTLSQTICLPDHDDFSNYQPPVTDGSYLLCTEKDAVKLFRLSAMASVRVLAVPLQFQPEPAFMAAVDSLLAPLLTARLNSQLPSSHGH